MRIESLKKMAEVDIRTVRKENLIDIKDVKVDTQKSQEERIVDFIQQIKNPYCFLCNDIIVKSNFPDKKETLEDRLTEYFISL